MLDCAQKGQGARRSDFAVIFFLLNREFIYAFCGKKS